MIIRCVNCELDDVDVKLDVVGQLQREFEAGSLEVTTRSPLNVAKFNIFQAARDRGAYEYS